MTPDGLIATFNTLADAPEGVTRLRELVLQLAVRGKLVAQDPDDEPANVLLERIGEERSRLITKKRLRPQQVRPRVDGSDDLRAGWMYVHLGDVLDLEYGKGLPARARNEDGAVDVYGSNGIVGRHDEALIDTPCVVVGRKGSSGAVNIAYRSCWPIDTAYFVVPRATMPVEFLALLLRAARLDGLDRATAIPGLNREDAYAVPTGLPPVAEQHRIVAKVDELMALLDRLEAARATRESTRTALRNAALHALQSADSPEEVEIAWNHIAERMDDLFADAADVHPLRQTVLELAVRGRLVRQNPDDEPASALLERIAEEKQQLIKAGKIRKRRLPDEPPTHVATIALPSGWQWCQLADVLLGIEAGWSPAAEKRPRSGEEWGVLKVSACSWGEFLPDENKALTPDTTPRRQHEVQPGDFLISRANTVELVARSVVVNDCPPRLMLSDKTLRLHPASAVDVHYLNLANLAVIAREYYRTKATGTSDSMRNVSQDAIWSTPVPLPPLFEQRRIVAKVGELTVILDRLQQHLADMTKAHNAFATAAVHDLGANQDDVGAVRQESPSR